MLWYLQSMQGFYSSKTPVHRWNLVRHLTTKLQQTNCILCGYITNSRDHRPLSKLLRHALLQILQWNKQPSGMTIITSAPPRYFRYRILALRVLPIRRETHLDAARRQEEQERNTTAHPIARADPEYRTAEQQMATARRQQVSKSTRPSFRALSYQPHNFLNVTDVGGLSVECTHCAFLFVALRKELPSAKSFRKPKSLLLMRLRWQTDVLLKLWIALSGTWLVMTI